MKNQKLITFDREVYGHFFTAMEFQFYAHFFE